MSLAQVLKKLKRKPRMCFPIFVKNDMDIIFSMSPSLAFENVNKTYCVHECCGENCQRDVKIFGVVVPLKKTIVAEKCGYREFFCVVCFEIFKVL